MLCSAGQWCCAVHIYVVLWSVVLWSGACSGAVRCGVVQWNSAVHAVVWCIQWSSAVYGVMWFIQWCGAVQCCAVVCGAYSGAGSG
jgi:hypothetical protein